LTGKRDLALLNLLIRTGLRTIEVIRADIGDIRQQGTEALLWIQGKGQDAKDQFVILTDNTLRPIYEYLQARGARDKDKPLYASISDRNNGTRLTTRSVRRIVKERLRSIGIDSERLTAHSLRHTTITLSLEAGATIQEAQALGRHANINTTLIYAHNIDRLKNAPERLIDKLLGGEIPKPGIDKLGIRS
jgi:integrase/recombinase XerC/integrase/recombinase XerD